MTKKSHPKSDMENGGAKEKPITQSTRFTPQQMREVEQACARRGWSISQLMLRATLEKAVGINHVVERPPQVQQSAKMLAAALYGILPRIKCAGVDIPAPEDRYNGWYSSEDGVLEYEMRDRYQVLYHEKERTLRIRDRIIIELAEDDKLYDMIKLENVDDRVNYLQNKYSDWADTNEADTITPVSIPAESVQSILECLSALGSEMVWPIKEAYENILLERGRVGNEEKPKKLKTALDLLQPEEDE